MHTGTEGNGEEIALWNAADALSTIYRLLEYIYSATLAAKVCDGG